MINLTGNLLELSTLDQVIQFVGMLVIALGLILLQRKSDLSRTLVYPIDR